MTVTCVSQEHIGFFSGFGAQEKKGQQWVTQRAMIIMTFAPVLAIVGRVYSCFLLPLFHHDPTGKPLGEKESSRQKKREAAMR